MQVLHRHVKKKQRASRYFFFSNIYSYNICTLGHHYNDHSTQGEAKYKSGDELREEAGLVACFTNEVAYMKTDQYDQVVLVVEAVRDTFHQWVERGNDRLQI